MKIVILDAYTTNPGDLSWHELETLGTLFVYDRTAPEDVVTRIGDAEIVFTNKTILPHRLFDLCPSIRFLGLLSTGYNIVDLSYAREKNVTVCNIPAYSTASVAQHTIALLLELCQHVGAHSDAVKRGAWVESRDFCFWNTPLYELKDKTMGIIGFGAIGQAVAKIADTLGMQILYTNSRRAPISGVPYTYADTDTLLSAADVISLHCPLTAETEDFICRETISKMKDGCFLINTARGAVVNEHDLFDALESGKIGGAALDVVSAEPMTADNPLLNAKNCIITPHIAWATPEARGRLIKIAAENLRQFLNGTPQNKVS